MANTSQERVTNTIAFLMYLGNCSQYLYRNITNLVRTKYKLKNS